MRILAPLILTVLVSMLASCSNKETGNVAGPSPSPATASDTSNGKDESPEDMLPALNSVVIVPSSATANSTLGVQYDVKDQNSDGATFHFRWFVDNSLVQEGPNDTLVPGLFKKGSLVSVEVIPSGPFGTGMPLRSETITIGNTPPVLTSFSIKPAPAFVGSLLTAVPDAKDMDGDLISYSYQWKVNGAPLPDSENSETFSTQNFRKKDVVSVSAIPFDGIVVGGCVVARIVLSNSAPQITSEAPADITNGIYLYQVAARDPESDPLTYSLVTAPSGMTIKTSTGLIQWTPPSPAADKQEVIVKVAVDDNDGGIAYQQFSLFLQMK